MRTTRTWSTEDLTRATGKRLCYGADGVTLRRGETIADEMGKCNDRDREPIRGRRRARKTFHLERVSCDRAVLSPYLECDRAGGRLGVTVNGHELEHVWSEDRAYWTDRWTPLEIPGEWLITGNNTVEFRSLDESEWSLLIESSRQPNRSELSEDGGASWRSDDLGWNDGCDGEYMVRLWLGQYPVQATLDSDVIDLCLDPNRGVAVSGIHNWSIEPVYDLSEGTRVETLARSGPTPVYDPETWSAWSPAEGEMSGDRFGQWRIVLVSEAGTATPTLCEVTVRVSLDGHTTRTVLERSQGPLRYSSYRFAQASSSEPRAERLKDKWKLNEVVRGAESEWEAYLRLRQWVRDQWEDGWGMGDIDFCPPWDAMLILELTSRKLSLGMCTHYATVMSQCCASLGLNARTQIMRSHCINEVWSSEHVKWVAMDVGGDNDDETKFVYHFERDGLPLSARECHEAWVNDDYADVKISPEPPPATKGRYAVEKRLQLFERFMISLRNDEMRSLEPGESEHGKGSYHYDGYLFWEDEKTEALPWFSHHTGRENDLYWSVNQTYIHLREAGELGTHLDVILETPTPDLKCFEHSYDGEIWDGSDARFSWDLKDGNRLFVRSVNQSGRPGPVSSVEVTDG